VTFVSPLVRQQPTRYAAPPEPIPWWEPLVAYVLVLAAAVLCILAFFFSMSLMGCESNANNCPDLTQSVLDGTVRDVRVAIQLLLGLAVVIGISIHFLAGKLHYAIVWPLAALPLVIGLLTIGWATGLAATPWGHL